jgi:plasmid stabilization system protein ParE
VTERRIRFRRAAQGDVDAAVAWYDNQAEGLRAELLAEVEHVIARIAANPNQFPIVRRQRRY